MRFVATAIACVFMAGCSMHHPPSAPVASSAPAKENIILVRQSTSTPDQVVDAIKSYAEKNKWAYLGANKVKNGELTLVKVCIPAVGAVLWGAGLEYSALLPCGNLAVYQKAGRTEVSMLDPHYMAALSPRPETTRAAEMARPLMTQMLDTVAR